MVQTISTATNNTYTAKASRPAARAIPIARTIRANERATLPANA